MWKTKLERDMTINACRLGRGGYIKTQLFLYHAYYADDMFRRLWAIFRSQKCIMRKTIQCMIISRGAYFYTSNEIFLMFGLYG